MHAESKTANGNEDGQALHAEVSAEKADGHRPDFRFGPRRFGFFAASLRCSSIRR
jgi:hypothetical protein